MLLKSAALAVALLCVPLTAQAETGMASWYGSESGTKTASGERFVSSGMTCAMRTHNWRWVTVTVLSSGKSARCRVNDYGPAKWTGKLIDVSMGMAVALGFKRRGVAKVSVQ
jgi:rare lipoprotein A